MVPKMFCGALLLLLAVSSVHGGGGEGSWQVFMRKYANVKILSDCLGEDYMMYWYKNYTEAVDFCQMQGPEVFLRDVPLTDYSMESLSFEQLHDPVHQANLLMPDYQKYLNLPTASGASPPTGTQADSSGLVDLSNYITALQGNVSQPILLVPLPYPLLQELSHMGAGNYFYRKKRDAGTDVKMFDAKKIQEIYQRLQAKTANFTCIVKRLKIFNAAFDVDATEILSHYNHLNLDVDLKNDITEGILDCIKFAMCKPLNKMSLTPPIVQRAMGFLKCEAKQRVASCVKNDVKKMQHKFDLKALGNVKAGVDVDEGDKMMAIMWGEFSKE